MQTAISAVELVEQHYEIALAIARQWGRRWKQFAADFESAAGLTLWRCATKWRPDRATFKHYLNKQVRFAMVDVIRRAAPPLPQFTPAPGDDGHPLHGVHSRELDPADAAELADDLEQLPRLLDTLPERRRAEVIRYFSGDTFATIAAEVGGTASGAQARVARGIERLQRQAGTAEKPPT